MRRSEKENYKEMFTSDREPNGLLTKIEQKYFNVLITYAHEKIDVLTQEEFDKFHEDKRILGKYSLDAVAIKKRK
jgi:hypothetical protein